MNQQREKTCCRGKKLFSGGFGFFFKFQRGIDLKVEVDQLSFLGGITLCREG